MTNTTIQLRRTATAGNVPNPDMMTLGELILNYADGNLFFLASNTTVQRIGGESAPAYGVVSVGGVSTIAAIGSDTLTFVENYGVKLTATAANDTIQVAADTSSNLFEQALVVAVGPETSNIGIGTANISFRFPFAATLTRIPRAMLTIPGEDVPTTMNINQTGTSIFSTNLSIDATETTSTTAAVPAVLASSSIADDALITVNIEQAGANAKGLKVTFYYTRSA